MSTPFRHADAGHATHLPRAGASAFSGREWWHLAAAYAFIGGLHALGWGLFLHYAAHRPAMAGLGVAAYLFGLRHAFDADHIAAVDDTVRYMLARGDRPLALGFFFSLGHSTVVLALAVGIALAASLFTTALPGLRDVGGVIGAGVSAAFLWIIGFLNLRVLLDLVSAWRTGRARGHGHAHVDELLQQRGLMNRLLGGRLRQWMRHSWQMFPLGLLFGMGFDTASEIALLALTAGAATGYLPLGAVLSLPLLFAAGMTLLDTTDGVLMCRAYAWASHEPARRMLCNITTTAVTVAVALLIGTLGWLQVMRSLLGLRGGVFDFADALDPGALGGMVVGLLLVTWVACAAWFRWGQAGSAARLPHVHAHPHTHANGVTHSHRHLH